MNRTQSDIFFIEVRIKAIRSECDMITQALDRLKDKVHPSP